MSTGGKKKENDMNGKVIAKSLTTIVGICVIHPRTQSCSCIHGEKNK